MGTSITVEGEGLPPGKQAEFVWATVQGAYDMSPMVETIQYHDRKFEPKQATLGRAVIDAAGRVSASFTVPDDYGETHDIVLTVDGQEVAQGGFAIVRHVTISPTEGPVGTPITIEVKGLGWTPYANTMGVLWDNNYTGFLSAVTTRGTAVGHIRAAGPPGTHTIRVTDASAAMPYLNTQQSPRKLPQFEFDFKVTGDSGAPAPTLDWPSGVVGSGGEAGPRTTASLARTTGGPTATLSPASGPILSKPNLTGTGLPSGATLDMVWVSVKGNRVSPSGWNLTERPLGKVTVASNGTLESSIEVPDDLGGWHVVRLVEGEKVLAEAQYYVERSFLSVTQGPVKAGEQFQVQIKGIGWTELDNGVAVVYDNSYMGYACGFNSQGDVTLILTAHGEPGTHLIDIYPMIFKGHGEGPWNYAVPQLTSAGDAPGLALGYRLPVIRVAIEVTE